MPFLRSRYDFQSSMHCPQGSKSNALHIPCSSENNSVSIIRVRLQKVSKYLGLFKLKILNFRDKTVASKQRGKRLELPERTYIGTESILVQRFFLISRKTCNGRIEQIIYFGSIYSASPKCFFLVWLKPIVANQRPKFCNFSIIWMFLLKVRPQKVNILAIFSNAAHRPIWVGHP